MIAGIFHSGSGLGNMLHRYVMTRVLALDKKYDFTMVAPENFKGKGFMDLYMGITANIPYHVEYPAGKVVADSHLPLWLEGGNQFYNPEVNFVKNDTIIDGEFQDERYFEHRLEEIDSWLAVEPLHILHDVCIIGFRGGEYALYPELFLDMKYWTTAVETMQKENPKMKFQVVTDDPDLARTIFPFEVSHDIGMDWRKARYAKYAIIANSSFFILPRLLSKGITIAPRRWAKYNAGKEWGTPQNYYKSFRYI